MNALVLRVAVVVLALALPAWILLSLVVVLGRARYERKRREPISRALRHREAERLVRRVSRRPRTEWGKWRRVAALIRLEQAHHSAVPRLILPVLADADTRIATAAIRTLGDIGDEWAIDLLISALRSGNGPRSRIAAELEPRAGAGPEARTGSAGLESRGSVLGRDPPRAVPRARRVQPDRAHLGLGSQRPRRRGRDTRGPERCGSRSGDAR